MRQLNTETLDGAARYYASAFAGNPSFVMQQFYQFAYKDEFEYLLAGVREWMSAKALKEFDRLAGNVFKPRTEEVLAAELAARLAVDLEGAHVPGKIGRVQQGQRYCGMHTVEVEAPWSIRRRKAKGLGKEHRGETITKEVPLYWPIYAGEPEERLAGSDAVDEFPPGTPGPSVGALNTRISNEIALLMADACVDNLDEGTGAAILRGYTTAQATDPDTAVGAQVLLFTLTCSATAFGNAADAAPGGTATAASITADTLADATNTLAWLRASSTNDGATPLDDHIDGEAGTSGADFTFNTLSIVANANVSMSAWTITQPES